MAAARARERAVTLPVLAVCVWAAEEGAHVAKREQQRRRDEEALLVAQARAAERAVSALLPPFIAAARAGAFHLTLHRSMEQASADAQGRSVGGSGGVAAREAAAAAAAAAAAEDCDCVLRLAGGEWVFVLEDNVLRCRTATFPPAPPAPPATAAPSQVFARRHPLHYPALPHARSLLALRAKHSGLLLVDASRGVGGSGDWLSKAVWEQAARASSGAAASAQAWGVAEAEAASQRGTVVTLARAFRGRHGSPWAERPRALEGSPLSAEAEEAAPDCLQVPVLLLTFADLAAASNEVMVALCGSQGGPSALPTLVVPAGSAEAALAFLQDAIQSARRTLRRQGKRGRASHFSLLRVRHGRSSRERASASPAAASAAAGDHQVGVEAGARVEALPAMWRTPSAFLRWAAWALQRRLGGPVALFNPPLASGAAMG